MRITVQEGFQVRRSSSVYPMSDKHSSVIFAASLSDTSNTMDSGGIQGHDFRNRFWEHQNMDTEINIFQVSIQYVTCWVQDESETL